MNEIDLRRIDLNLLVVFEVLMTEGSVTRAAARLGRTQSAVSHSLARLREQIGDPLLVKTGNGMAPSPFASRLVEDVRPILRSIERIVAPPEPFDPSTSRRVFRLAIADFAPTLLPRVIGELQRRAPGICVQWLAPDAQTMASVADGGIDLALFTSSVPVPEGVQRQSAGELQSVTFARSGHPAIGAWSAAEWAKWPHVQVRLGERARGSVDAAAEDLGLKRRIGAWVPNFSQVPALVAQTDLLATMTPLVMAGAMQRLRLRALEPPIPIRPTSFCFAWSFRLANDPGSRWLRTIVMQAYAELQRDAVLQTSGRNLVKAAASFRRRPRAAAPDASGGAATARGRRRT